MSDLPVVCVFGKKLVLQSEENVPDFETNKLDCRCYETDENLEAIVAQDRPVSIVSIGEETSFPKLCSAPHHIRRIWQNFDEDTSPKDMGWAAFHLFLSIALSKPDPMPLISVFTPTFESGDKAYRPYHSMLSQTYGNWEWVIVDDCSQDKATRKILEDMAANDARIRYYSLPRRSGSIGENKRTACDLSRGFCLVELDHDDHIVPDLLGNIVTSFGKHPEVGFLYSDFAECTESGGEVKYPDGWGLGYGSYRNETIAGMKYAVVNSPNINAKTIRHIVAAPNHVRVWRKNIYDEIGGHNPSFHVVDDYELMIRTFLATRMGHIPKMSYIQYRNEGGNAHQTRNKDIQRLVRYVSNWYDVRIHERLVELGVDDFVWEGNGKSFNRLTSVPNPKVESHCTIQMEV